MVALAAEPATPSAKPAVRPRVWYLDNLRVLLICLVILQHLSITFGNPTGDFYFVEPGKVGTVPGYLMVLFEVVNESFFMGLFLAIAAYFTPSAYDRKGAWTYLADRLKRLGIPLVFYTLVVNPLLQYAVRVHSGYRGDLW